MKFAVSHRTAYSYADAVSICHNIAHLSPRVTQRQTPLAGRLDIKPKPRVIVNFTDYFGNHAHFFAIDESHIELSATSTLTVEVTPVLPLPEDSLSWEKACALTSQSLEAYPFTLGSTYVKPSPQLEAYALRSFLPARTLLDAALDLTRRIHQDFEYDPSSTTVATPLESVFRDRRGVCQDFAHLQIACLRSLGLAARYTSGYIRTLPPPGKERLVGADATHAWVSIYCPPVGWIDLDPTNNMLPSTDHITVAWGRDFEDVSPIKGVILGGGEHSVAVSVDVCPLPEPPLAVREQAAQAGQ